jgi:hypothetical protein
MKVALLLTGLPRKVEEGYIHYWKHIVENYNTDVYLQYWEDEEYEKVLQVYKPVKYIQEKPFKFTKYKEGINSFFADGVRPDDMSRPLPQYDVAGNFRGFPMFYSWQIGYNLIEGEYDCIIRSRYDLGTQNPIKLENLDLSKINISNWHWGGSEIMDDNICITNQTLSDILFKNVFDEFIDYSKQTGKIFFQEKNFTEILNRKNLNNYICKTNELPFTLLREMGLWY